MKTLIVDDDKLVRKALSHFLETNGYETVLAQNGFEALNMVKTGEINLIICDVMMPNLSGLEFLNLLKEFYYNKIPVIIISSLDMAQVVVCSLGLGISEYVKKPVDLTKLLSLMKKYIKKDKTAFN